MINCKKNPLIMSALVCALALPFVGCKGKKAKTAQKEYTVEKRYRDLPGEHARHKGEKHREKIKGEVRGKKEAVQRKVCKMCGGKTAEGKCVVCGK